MPFRTPNSMFSKKGKTPPPEDTFEEASYLKWLGEKQKPVSVKMKDGEIVRGWVEYYDRDMIRLTREGAPNLFIFKHDIMYIAEGVLRDAREPQARTRRVKAKSVAAAEGSTAAPETSLIEEAKSEE